MPTEIKTIYYGLDHAPLDNRDCHAAVNGNINYYAKAENLALGWCEQKGARLSQEDRIASTHLDCFAALTPSQQYDVIKKTINAMQNQYGQSSEIGATINQSIIINKAKHLDITTCNLGDSRSFIFILTHGSHELKYLRLNPEVHNPDTLKESIRLQKFFNLNNPYPNERLLTGLAISRSIGDRFSEAFGLIHEPDIYQHHFELNDNETAFILTFCDGLQEALSDEELAKLVLKYADFPPYKMALQLCYEGISSGSKDNISIAAYRVDTTTNNNISMAIFDGHNGHEVAEDLHLHYYQKLEELCNAAQKDNG